MITLSKTIIGKPFMWETAVYGRIAVHIDGLSPNGRVARVTIDGGADSTPANRFPELSDGIGHATESQLKLRKVRVPVRRSGRVAPREATALPKATQDMTMLELRRHAKDIGMSTATKLTRKSELLAAIQAFSIEKKEEVTF